MKKTKTSSLIVRVNPDLHNRIRRKALKLSEKEGRRVSILEVVLPVLEKAFPKSRKIKK